MTISMAAKATTIKARNATFIVGVVYGIASALSSGWQGAVEFQRLKNERHDQIGLNMFGFFYFEMAQLYT